MEFRQLKYFVAVAEEGNIGRAAMRLNVSQPPVSRQIQALELELGTKLLRRTPFGVTLTDAGEVFLRDAQTVLANSRNAVDRVQAADRGEIGRLDIGYFGATVYQIVPWALQRLKAKNPQISLSLTQMNKAEQANAIREGRIHIGFGRYFAETPGITIQHLTGERLVAAVPVNNPFADQGAVRLADLAKTAIVAYPSGDRPNLTDEIMSIFRSAGHEIEVADIVGDSIAALCMVSSGDFCTLVPSSITNVNYPGLRYIPIEDDDTIVGTSCIYSSDSVAPVLRVFLDALEAD